VVAPVACCLLLVAGFLYYYKAQKARHHNLLGAVLPPGVGAGTTLLVTDIQDSTPLYEMMDPAVMDGVTHMHHAAIREAAHKHRGYEICTEGE
jgi:class 3 adenylate cyclase